MKNAKMEGFKDQFKQNQNHQYMILKQLHPLLSKKTIATALLIPDMKVSSTSAWTSASFFQENGCQLIEGAYGIKAD